MGGASPVEEVAQVGDEGGRGEVFAGGEVGEVGRGGEEGDEFELEFKTGVGCVKGFGGRI